MDKVLLELINLDRVRELERSECQNPEELLGDHPEKVGMLYTAYLPDAKNVSVRIGDDEYPMERVDADGFFAMIYFDKKIRCPYRFRVEYQNGESEETEDPYAHRFGSRFTDEDLRKFEAGTFYGSYEKMGAHPLSIDDVAGVHFAVWAPNAMRVSVIGDFNFWNGKRHQMKRLGASGIYELFIPGLRAGEKYKYEIKTQKGELILKSDPYAFLSELRPATASVIWDGSRFQWRDEAWMTERKQKNGKDTPVSICEVDLGSWIRNSKEEPAEGQKPDGKTFYGYRELANRISSYVKEMGYTHVEFMPVMEHPLDESRGYQITGYYAPTSRHGTPDDFRWMIDHLHQEGIGVILGWMPAYFPKDAHGLAAFDGGCLYEHFDPRQRELTQWGTLAFHYGRPQVSNFLISNALYWAKEFHADGLRVASVELMLYLDFGRNSGEWLSNMYGGHENLDAVEFIKHLNSVFHRETDGAVLIAEEAASWPRVTGDLKEEGLGFDYKWNSGWQSDVLRYMQCAPQERLQSYGDLTLSMLYAYSEDFVHGFSHEETAHGRGALPDQMPGDSQEERLAKLRVLFGYLFGHPGKKHFFMEQESEQEEWKEYVKALNHLYRTQPALYERDYHPEGFEWINCTCDTEHVIVFQRCADRQEDMIVFVCNFASGAYEDFRFGVPFPGTYREILNSDDRRFGGLGLTNPGEICAEEKEKDHRKQSIHIRLAPWSVCAFQYIPECRENGTSMKEESDRAPDDRKESEDLEGIVSGIFESPLHTAKAASEAIAKRGADALDKLSERVGKIVKRK